MTRPQFEAWLKDAKPGEKTVYHTGSLINDREKGPNFLALKALAAGAWALMEAGKVELSQRFILPGVHAYIALKRKAGTKPVAWEGCYHPEWTGP